MKMLTMAGAMVLGLSGCASITTGTTQPLTIDTPYADGASCELKDSAGGSWYIKSTPDMVTVNKGNGPMRVSCEKQGFNKGTTMINETFQGATLGNILLGGGVGIIVDASTGAAQEYPKDAKVFLEPSKWQSDAQRQQWLDEKLQYEQLAFKKENPNAGRDMNDSSSPRKR